MIVDVEAFIEGYVEAMTWADLDTGNPDELGSEPGMYSVDEVDEDSMALIRSECEDFINQNYYDLCAYVVSHNERFGMGPYWVADGSEHAGQDFYLTRTGHGAGFWDRGMGEIGDRLTAASKPYGVMYCYLADEKVHVS